MRSTIRAEREALRRRLSARILVQDDALRRAQHESRYGAAESHVVSSSLDTRTNVPAYLFHDFLTHTLENVPA